MARVKLVQQQIHPETPLRGDKDRRSDADRGPSPDLDALHRKKLAFFKGLTAAIGGSILFWIAVYLCLKLVAS